MAISTIGASALDSGVSQLGKNLIHNGAVPVSQRGVNATIVTGFDSTTNSYIADRFLASGNGSPQNRADLKHVSSGGPTGFPNFIRYDVTTAETAVAAGESSIIQQRIEGFNLQSIQASSGIVALTLQFYMRSPKTGTHCVYLSTQNTRNIVKEFTVASADTWEKHTVSFVADASGGTVSNAATEFLRVGWPIIAGTTYQGTADAWTASNIFATSNQQNLADNTANNIDITGVQLEVGSVATDFEHEDISVTLAKCQRYLRHLVSTTNTPILAGYSGTTTAAYFSVQFDPVMRAAPTFSVSAVGDFTVDMTGAGRDTTNLTINKATTYAARLDATVASGLVAGQAVQLAFKSTGKTLTFTAEL
jgi:mannose/fructose-specific phosphotransferase system component IIA